MTEADKIKELKKQREELEKRQENHQTKRSGFLTASGILTIIVSCIILIFGIIYLLNELPYVTYYYYNLFVIEKMIGIQGVLGFSVGLAGGILTLQRIQKYVAILCISFMLASSIAVTALLSYTILGYFFTILTILLSIISLVFLGVANKNFERK